MSRKPRLLAPLIAASVFGLAACGGGTSDDQADAPSTTAKPSTATTVEGQGEPTAGAVRDLEGVQAATVQIVAQGSFVDPEVGQYESAGSGSGFIIDGTGLAVTNNHVVGGSGLLQVYVGGEDEPRNAKVLGTSECSDLAVIDIEGDEFPYVHWFDGAVRPGLEVYAAGYPLGDPEYTLTKGIIAKAAAAGDTNWASVDHVLEHDANIQPGNSGGALVNAEGAVVAVNYAGGDVGGTGTSQFFAIAGDEAREVVESLAAGQDVTYLGMNGQAVLDPDSGLSGIWVSAVETGSPASEAGIQGGDIVTSLEGIQLAQDGTMKDYCDVLRSRNDTDKLAVQVLRYGTQEVLAGEINGKPLAVTFSFAQEEDDVADVPESDESYRNFRQVTDDTGSLSIEVPTDWVDTSGTSTDIGGVSSPMVQASPDLDAFLSGWEVPGAEVIASTELVGYDDDQLLDVFEQSASCTNAGRQEFSSDVYSGKYDTWTDCGGTGTAYFVVSAEAADGSHGLVVAVQVVSDADLEALDHMLSSLSVR